MHIFLFMHAAMECIHVMYACNGFVYVCTESVHALPAFTEHSHAWRYACNESTQVMNAFM